MTVVLVREGRRCETQTQSGRPHEDGVMCLEAKEYQGLRAATRSEERGVGWILPQNL